MLNRESLRRELRVEPGDDQISVAETVRWRVEQRNMIELDALNWDTIGGQVPRGREERQKIAVDESNGLRR